MAKEDLNKGNEDTQFTPNNQPSPEAKSKGKRKALLLKDIASKLITGESKTALEDLAKYLGVEVDSIDIETAMHLKQMEKAVKNGDTRAYNAVMDRIKGRPIQAIEVTENTIKTAKYVNATKRG
tara:strand:+ start:1561 stop:1932 length:372 start_codon:yes stop_codon:yes gene_type:complete